MQPQFIVLYGPSASGKTYFTNNSLHTLTNFNTTLPLRVFYIGDSTPREWAGVKALLDTAQHNKTNIVCEMLALNYVPPELRDRVTHCIRFDRGSPTPPIEIILPDHVIPTVHSE